MAYIGIPKPRQILKLHSCAVKGFLVRYAQKTKGYGVWIPQDDKIIETLNLTFYPNLTTYLNGAVLGPVPNFEQTNLLPWSTKEIVPYVPYNSTDTNLLNELPNFPSIDSDDQTTKSPQQTSSSSSPQKNYVEPFSGNP